MVSGVGERTPVEFRINLFGVYERDGTLMIINPTGKVWSDGDPSEALNPVPESRGPFALETWDGRRVSMEFIDLESGAITFPDTNELKRFVEPRGKAEDAGLLTGDIQ
jgi:hypothetical protein